MLSGITCWPFLTKMRITLKRWQLLATCYRRQAIRLQHAYNSASFLRNALEITFQRKHIINYFHCFNIFQSLKLYIFKNNKKISSARAIFYKTSYFMSLFVCVAVSEAPSIQKIKNIFHLHSLHFIKLFYLRQVPHCMHVWPSTCTKLLIK